MPIKYFTYKRICVVCLTATLVWVKLLPHTMYTQALRLANKIF
jgi:hypothetical protein